MDGAGNVKETFVDGDPLDQRSEFVEHRDHRITQTLVLMEMATDELDRGAKLSGPPAGHATPDSVGPGLV